MSTGQMSTFLTARAAARQMVEQGSGVILAVTSETVTAPVPMMGNTGPTDAAVESFLRCLAAEVGPQGVRVLGATFLASDRAGAITATMVNASCGLVNG